MMMPGMMGPGGAPGSMMMPGMMGPGGAPGSMMAPGAMGPGMMGPGMMGPGMMRDPTLDADMAGGMMPGMEGMMMPGMDAGMMPGMEGMMMPGMEGMMMPGMDAGMMPGGMAGQKKEKPPTKISQLRVLLVADDAIIDSGSVPVGDELAMNPELSDKDGWVRVAVPLSQFKPMRSPKPSSLREVAVFGDVKGEFYIDSIRLVQEDQPLKADAGPDRVVRKDQEVTFNAAPQAGAAKARYAWDFDELVEGIEEDALGQKASHAFEEEGFYAVTLTVTDPEGRRIPRVDRVNVTVQ
jgi:hypothetical protein